MVEKLSQWEAAENYWSVELGGEEKTPAERSMKHKKNKDVANKVSVRVCLYLHLRAHKLEDSSI